ncbi:hypothetical protein [Limnoglobus roseus]|uniref:Uncharacterized protein n=1 Tax=Limnoglobus roseus TaxID=2598579 RepID=A0A5C1APV9_9BACT|nr:hypothetical protein [Limnoglobus roseus]QEL19264.1 hypothetical protein PX52LOC_06326 [Limnoglobus roseus]
MTVPTISAVYDLAHHLTDELVEALTDSRQSKTVDAALSGLRRATAAVALDVDRVSINERRAADRLRLALDEVNGRTLSVAAATALKQVLGRWFGPRGLPAEDEEEFDRQLLAVCGPIGGG